MRLVSKMYADCGARTNARALDDVRGDTLRAARGNRSPCAESCCRRRRALVAVRTRDRQCCGARTQRVVAVCACEAL